MVAGLEFGEGITKSCIIILLETDNRLHGGIIDCSLGNTSMTLVFHADGQANRIVDFALEAVSVSSDIVKSRPELDIFCSAQLFSLTLNIP